MQEMSAVTLAYPFLFVAIFFQSFILVTLLSGPARAARRRRSAEPLPSVAVIVPCWNEESTITATCESLLALDYPEDKLEIILVDDGSTDGTPALLAKLGKNPRVKTISKQNGGKHTALNAGIASTTAEFVGCLDADSFVDKKALLEIVKCFTDDSVAAATGAMSIHEPSNLLQHMQNAEYTFGITFRHAISSINGLYVTPGPFSFYRRSIVEALGGFRYGHQTEDMEMALRIQQAGYKIENAPRALVFTKAPSTLLSLVKQRTRWTSGFLRNILGEYRGLIFDQKRGALGMVVLPAAVLSIGSGILLFVTMLASLAERGIVAIEVRAGVPLTYVVSPHGSFDWFYFPASVYVFLGLTTLVSALLLIVAGKRIAKTPGNIALGLISYTLMYGFIVPLWLIRATTDVSTGTRRGWRG
jgi:cellulose synthase/poly-beta-1,6-N-acetylglucosamine synthase-like glycosyltransferase